MIDIEKILNYYGTKRFHLQNPKEIKSGKEATVFVAYFDGKPLAIKVYIDPQLRAFKDSSVYREGKFFRNPSNRKAVLKGNTYGKRLLHRSWIRREFYLLDKLHKLGANVPLVYEWSQESILMEFIGDNTVAPRLIDTQLSKNEAKSTFETLLKNVELLLKCGIVHGDLSAYNILWWYDKPYIIDLPQAIDIRQNPNRDELLNRDLNNLITYFSKYFAIDSERIYTRFKI